MFSLDHQGKKLADVSICSIDAGRQHESVRSRRRREVLHARGRRLDAAVFHFKAPDQRKEEQPPISCPAGPVERA